MPTDPTRCIYLDPARGYHMCRLPVAPGALLLCPKHLEEAKARQAEHEKTREAIREFHREDKP